MTGQFEVRPSGAAAPEAAAAAPHWRSEVYDRGALLFEILTPVPVAQEAADRLSEALRHHYAAKWDDVVRFLGPEIAAPRRTIFDERFVHVVVPVIVLRVLGHPCEVSPEEGAGGGL